MFLMEKYKFIKVVGEGSYGVVMKCLCNRNKKFVAIKKFFESENNMNVRRIATREIGMLKNLKHENLIKLIEVFKNRKNIYLVFDYIDYTLLDLLNKYQNGFNNALARKYMWQIVKAVDYCHMKNIVHRDIKPENILVNKIGLVKVCDFGFARSLSTATVYTNYVATRWYRSPELIVGESQYGKYVDIWSLGCLLSEMLTGEPLIPGVSDIDMIYRIVQLLGNLPLAQKKLFVNNHSYFGIGIPESIKVPTISLVLKNLDGFAVTLIEQCLHLEPYYRPTTKEILNSSYFCHDNFNRKIHKEIYKLLIGNRLPHLESCSTENKKLQKRSKPPSNTSSQIQIPITKNAEKTNGKKVTKKTVKNCHVMLQNIENGEKMKFLQKKKTKYSVKSLKTTGKIKLPHISFNAIKNKNV